MVRLCLMEADQKRVGGREIFKRYEEEVTNGRRSPGPIECFAFATTSRERTLPPIAFLLVFEITQTQNTDTTVHLTHCRIVFLFFKIMM